MTDHLSIGEVLSLLQDEFPDVTISKIRFLESQGLIDPERTPSGYRKFYESDIERLRWILVQQREHFLPLKVIKDRLEDPSTSTVLEAELPAAATVPADPTPEPEPAPEPASGPDGAAAPAEEPQPIWMADLARATAESKASAAAEAAQLPLGMDTGPSEVSLTAEELAQASGLSREALRQLEQYGLVVGRPLGDDVFYDGDALLVATKAAGFLAHGVEPRHLRMFKVAAEREAGFLEQLAMPLLKQRNPAARRDAVALVEELSALGHDLRSVLLRANLRQHLDSH